MYRVLIVDDDVYARSNLKRLIEWEKHGYEIIGEASNGKAAIQVIEDKNPDIIITDISMPVMDGIGLIEYVRKKSRIVKVIALSGYNDFEYVRQSMKNGAVDYLLKHKISPEELCNILKSACESIEHERKAQNHEQSLVDKLNIEKPFAKQNFIKDLLDGVLDNRDTIEDIIKSMDLKLDMKNLMVILAEIDDFMLVKEKYNARELNLFLQSFMDIVQEILDDSGKSMVSYVNEGRFAIIVSLGKMKSDLYIHSYILTVINRIKASIKRYFNITASFSMSRVCSDIDLISKYYNEAVNLLRGKLYKGKDNIINPDDSLNMDAGFVSLDIKDEKDITLYLKSMDTENTVLCIEKIFNKIYSLKANLDSISMICVEIINIINKIARENGIDISSVYQCKDTPYKRIGRFETIKDMEHWLAGACMRLICGLKSKKVNENYSEYTKKAIEYINENYRRDISLDDAARYVGISSTYLSRVFKNDCSMGFIEYLQMFRIEKAKVLMEESNFKIKEIAQRTGFVSYNYFFKVFKETTGMTPVEYEHFVMHK